MVDEDRARRLSRLLGAAGRAHHAEFGGPSSRWPEWYAARIHPEIVAIVGGDPTVEQVAEWLRRADESHRAQAPDDPWPAFYARWILDTVAG
jgi:hypothetical protein